MMKQTKHILFGLSLLAATAFTATSCNSILGEDDITGKEGGTMQLAFTRGGESSSPTSGFLIFWKSTMGDFFTTEVEDLNAYQSTKYNTGEPYPQNGAEVSATGFSPATMQHDDNYRTLSLPEGTAAGTLDVCAAHEVIKGNYHEPFNKIMEFRHTLTKITFSAKRDATMEGNQLVTNIKITVPGKYLATGWEWDTGTQKYTVSTTASAGANLISAPSGSLTVIEQEYFVMECFLRVPANNSGKLNGITMEADVIKVGESSDKAQHISKELDIQLYEEDGSTPVESAAPGDAYQVVFNFEHDSFSLQAIKMPWEEGGLITVPVDPDGGESTHSNN